MTSRPPHSPPPSAKIPQPPAEAGVRTVLNIVTAWQLEDSQTLDLMATNKAQLQAWRLGEISPLSDEQLERLSHVLGIYRALQILLPGSADAWVLKRNANPIFGSRAAIELMCADLKGLVQVSQFLRAQLV